MVIPERISNLSYVVVPRDRSVLISRAPSEWYRANAEFGLRNAMGLTSTVGIAASQEPPGLAPVVPVARWGGELNVPGATIP